MVLQINIGMYLLPGLQPWHGVMRTVWQTPVWQDVTASGAASVSCASPALSRMIEGKSE
jgi:hypothetical protein